MKDIEMTFYGPGRGKEVINLTPHAITIKAGGASQTIAPSGSIARVKMRTTPQRALVTLVVIAPVVFNEPGEIQGLPGPEKGKVYLVSSLVLAACKGRKDVYAPDTGPTCIRDEKGHIKAVTQLVTAHRGQGKCAACGMIDDITQVDKDYLCYSCAEGFAEE
jgi:hypothetical protein